MTTLRAVHGDRHPQNDEGDDHRLGVALHGVRRILDELDEILYPEVRGGLRQKTHDVVVGRHRGTNHGRDGARLLRRGVGVHGCHSHQKNDGDDDRHHRHAGGGDRSRIHVEGDGRPHGEVRQRDDKGGPLHLEGQRFENCRPRGAHDDWNCSHEAFEYSTGGINITLNLVMNHAVTTSRTICMRRVVPYVLLALLSSFATLAAIGSHLSRHPLVQLNAVAHVCHSKQLTRVTLETTSLVHDAIAAKAIEPTVLLGSGAVILGRPGINLCNEGQLAGGPVLLGEGTALVIGKPHLSTYLSIATDQSALVAGAPIFNSALVEARKLNLGSDATYLSRLIGSWSLTENGTAYGAIRKHLSGQQSVFFRIESGQPQFFYAACLPVGTSASEVKLCRDLTLSIVATNLLHFKTEASHP